MLLRVDDVGRQRLVDVVVSEESLVVGEENELAQFFLDARILHQVTRRPLGDIAKLLRAEAHGS